MGDENIFCFVYFVRRIEYYNLLSIENYLYRIVFSYHKIIRYNLE